MTFVASKLSTTLAMLVTSLSMGWLALPQTALADADIPRGQMKVHRFQQDGYKRRFMLYTP